MTEARTIQAQTIKRDLEAEVAKSKRLAFEFENAVALYNTSGSLLEQTSRVNDARESFGTFGDEVSNPKVLDDFATDVEGECGECDLGNPVDQHGMCTACLLGYRQERR